MLYTPGLRPLLPLGGRINAEIFYEKQYASAESASHDREHIHDFYEIYVNLSGEVSFLVEDTLYPVSHGDIIVTRPNEVHKCIHRAEGIHEHFCIWLDSLPAASEKLREEFGKQTLVVLSEEERERMIEVCGALWRLDLAVQLGDLIDGTAKLLGIDDKSRDDTDGDHAV